MEESKLHIEKKLEDEEKKLDWEEEWLGKDENENSPHRAEIKEEKRLVEKAQKQKGGGWLVWYKVLGVYRG